VRDDPPIQTTTNFHPVGESATGGATPTNAANVRVFYASAPDGFVSASADDLAVKEGYGHKIVGFIQIRTLGNCCCDMEPLMSREVIIDQLKGKAASVGADALVFASTTVPSKNDVKPGCDAMNAVPGYPMPDGSSVPLGSAWAVVLAK
jgi:hypothetical protein